MLGSLAKTKMLHAVLEAVTLVMVVLYNRPIINAEFFSRAKLPGIVVDVGFRAADFGDNGIVSPVLPEEIEDFLAHNSPSLVLRN